MSHADQVFRGDVRSRRVGRASNTGLGRGRQGLYGQRLPADVVSTDRTLGPGHWWGDDQQLQHQQFESVACPVGKDVEAGRIKRAEVMVIDRSPVANHDISCTLATHKKDGSQVQSVTQKSNSSFQIALPLSFGAQAAAVQGSYSLICTLPPMATVAGSPAPSTIVMYNVVEE